MNSSFIIYSQQIASSPDLLTCVSKYLNMFKQSINSGFNIDYFIFPEQDIFKERSPFLITSVVIILATLHTRGFMVTMQNLASERFLSFFFSTDTSLFSLCLAGVTGLYFIACVLLLIRGQIPSAFRKHIGLFHVLELRPSNLVWGISYEFYCLLFDIAFTFFTVISICYLVLEKIKNHMLHKLLRNNKQK
jgi:hypothetical protein